MKRKIAEAAGWICLLAAYIVAGCMDAGDIGLWAGGAISLALVLSGAFWLMKGGVIRVE